MTAKRISPKKHPLYPEIQCLKHIPSQVGTRSKISLYEFGKKHTGQGCVVEVGTYLGSSCAHLCYGMRQKYITVPVHCYDSFISNKKNSQTAAKHGIEIEEGASFIEHFKSLLAPIYPNVVPHAIDIRDFTWDQQPIEVFIDDACKKPSMFHHVFSEVLPSFIPGLTTFASLDHFYFSKFEVTSKEFHKNRYIDHVMHQLSDYFELIEDNSQYDSGAFFLYKKELTLDEFFEQATNPTEYLAMYEEAELST